MRDLISFQWLILFVFSTKMLCFATNGDSETFKFFKDEISSVPGPSMSFDKSLQNGIFGFEFKTFVERALLLYQDDEGLSEFIRLSIDGGRLELSSVLRQKKWDFSTSKEMMYNDFKWHTVRIERNLTHFNFILDGKTKTTHATARSPSLTSNLQLGGFPRSTQEGDITDRGAYSLYVTPLNWRGFFIGCIRNISYGKDSASLMPVDDIPSLMSHVTKGRCDLSLCDKRRKNNPPGICENHGVCVPAAGERPTTCDCRWTGYNGSTCTEDALRLTLSGSYKVAYKGRTPVPLVMNQEQFTLRIKTARKNATILVAKATKGRSDKLLLEIKDSRFMVTSNTGDNEGDDILRSSEVVGDNKWHVVKYHRNGSILSLTVDGNYSVNLTSNKADSSMKYKNIVYIGENSSLHNLTIEVEDFIWEYPENEINFVKGLFDSFASSKDEYMIIPSGVLPMFNRKLPGNVAKNDKEMNTSSTTASTDILDNCTKSNKDCHSNAYCSKTEGIHTCICKRGYIGDGIYNCTDIDECVRSPEPCHEHAQCSNTNGSYNCTCRTGFYGDGHFNCTDVDECDEERASCIGRGKCENSLGSYSCRCSIGFTGRNDNCTDINECAQLANVCGEYARCINNEGSFSCFKVCDPGYENDHGNCTDIDECVRSPELCHEHAQCSNTNGSYNCTCRTGFYGDGHFNCTDINECTGSVCHNLATCINTEGSFTCKCRSKYHGDGVYTCIPNSYCDVVSCFPGLQCIETTNDTYGCEKCPQFFVGDGTRCELNKSKNVVSVPSELYLTNEKWTDDLTKENSVVYKSLATKLIELIKKIYAEHPEFVYVLINKFRKGSVVAEFQLIFTKKMEDPFKPLQEAIKNDNFGNMTVEVRQPVANTGTEKKYILGLNQTIFICVVALVAGVCILGIAVIIFTLILRRNRQRNAQIHKGKPEEETLNLTEPQGLLYKTSSDEANGSVLLQQSES